MKETNEHDFTEKQEIWTGPVKEKTNCPGSGACWVETVKNSLAGPGISNKFLKSSFII